MATVWLAVLALVLVAPPALAQTWLGVRGPNRTMNESRGTLAAAESARAQSEAAYTWTYPSSALRTLRTDERLTVPAVVDVLSAEGTIVYEGSAPVTARACVFIIREQGQQRQIICGNEFMLQPGEHSTQTGIPSAAVHPQLRALSRSDSLHALRLVDTFASGYVLTSSDADPAVLLKTRSFRNMHLQDDQVAVLLAVVPGAYPERVRVALQPFVFVFEQLP